MTPYVVVVLAGAEVRVVAISFKIVAAVADGALEGVGDKVAVVLDAVEIVDTVVVARAVEGSSLHILLTASSVNHILLSGERAKPHGAPLALLTNSTKVKSSGEKRPIRFWPCSVNQTKF